MRRKRQPTGISIGVNLAPMIDMTFLLLIFFLVTTTFERVEGILASDLPPVSTSEGVPLPISPIVVRLSAQPGGAGCSIAVDHFGPPPNNFDELVDLIRQIQQKPGFDTKTPVVVVAEPVVRWDNVVDCWNAALRAGCKRVAFGKP